MVGVCCGCIAQPASVQPRKTYNNLVAGLFAGDPIKTSDPLDTTLRRKIQKLQEYIQKNPAKIPKVLITIITRSVHVVPRVVQRIQVDRRCTTQPAQRTTLAPPPRQVSRRLMRRIRQTLRSPGDNLGHVKVAVYALTYMLAMSADDESSYSPSFFAPEVVSGRDAVVPLLLRDPHIEIRTLGAELLAAFSAVQTEADTKLEAIQEMTPLVGFGGAGGVLWGGGGGA